MTWIGAALLIFLLAGIYDAARACRRHLKNIEDALAKNDYAGRH